MYSVHLGHSVHTSEEISNKLRVTLKYLSRFPVSETLFTRASVNMSLLTRFMTNQISRMIEFSWHYSRFRNGSGRSCLITPGVFREHVKRKPSLMRLSQRSKRTSGVVTAACARQLLSASVSKDSYVFAALCHYGVGLHGG